MVCVTAVYIAEHPKKLRETREQVLERCSRPAPSPFESDFTYVSALARTMKNDNSLGRYAKTPANESGELTSMADCDLFAEKR